MSELQGRDRLQPSLLDRLTDLAPDSRRETMEQQTLSLSQLRQAVLRDLGWLLNTTNLAALDDLRGFPRAARSTVNFGVPGFAGLAGTADRLTSLEAGIAEAIRTFEPRIRSETLKVRLREQDDEMRAAVLIFEIEGELWAQPVPQRLFLETAIELETGLAVVTDARKQG